MRPSYYIFPGLKQNLFTDKQLMEFREKGKRKDPGSLSLIFNEVCNYMGLQPDKVRKKSRKRELVWARQLYCYLAKKFTSMSLEQIGNVIGKKDHTTVIHSNVTAGNLIEKYPDLAHQAEVLGSKISDRLYSENKTIKEYLG